MQTLAVEATSQYGEEQAGFGELIATISNY
jgi:hypothetical protein